MIDLKPGDKLKPGAALDWLREDDTRYVSDKYGSTWHFSRAISNYMRCMRGSKKSFEADEVDLHDLLSSSEVTVL